jgi:hypothetical protein
MDELQIVLTDGGYWCRRKDLPANRKVVYVSDYHSFPDPPPDWMFEMSQRYSVIGKEE